MTTRVRALPIRSPAATVAAAALAAILAAAMPAGAPVAHAEPQSDAVPVIDPVPRARTVIGSGVPVPGYAVAAAGTEGLHPLLAVAYTMAEEEAHARGVPLWINSGYRSREEQQRMWEEGLRTYGNPEEARRWVLPPAESTHVTGRAIDVAPFPGTLWLEFNGNRWGLCRTFDNEWWHFELVTVPGTPCPPRIPDASMR
ncbi:M15 family metallopeptidase [Nocardia brevicatena]|uniref:M15 family metallopeptidase n=1 Tax=Nocardia brevicatena TaxID=37327 RepID=UPI001FDF7F58|nr:M15 family metallopeptidase [Nocardia brevicatena]